MHFPQFSNITINSPMFWKRRKCTLNACTNVIVYDTIFWGNSAKKWLATPMSVLMTHIFGGIRRKNDHYICCFNDTIFWGIWRKNDHYICPFNDTIFWGNWAKKCFSLFFLYSFFTYFGENYCYFFNQYCEMVRLHCMWAMEKMEWCFIQSGAPSS